MKIKLAEVGTPNERIVDTTNERHMSQLNETERSVVDLMNTHSSVCMGTTCAMRVR